MKKILVLMIAAVAALAITSCSKEDKKDTAFVGKWQCDDHYYGGSDVYEFTEEGTYTWRCPGWDSQSGVYSYTPSSISFSQYSGRTTTFILLSKTDSNFVIMDDDGDSYTYFRK